MDSSITIQLQWMLQLNILLFKRNEFLFRYKCRKETVWASERNLYVLLRYGDNYCSDFKCRSIGYIYRREKKFYSFVVPVYLWVIAIRIIRILLLFFIVSVPTTKYKDTISLKCKRSQTDMVFNLLLNINWSYNFSKRNDFFFIQNEYRTSNNEKMNNE